MSSSPHSGRVGYIFDVTSCWEVAQNHDLSTSKPRIIVLCDLGQIMTTRSAQIIKLAAESEFIASFWTCRSIFDVTSCWEVAQNHELSTSKPRIIVYATCAQIMTTRSTQIIKLAAESVSIVSFWTCRSIFDVTSCWEVASKIMSWAPQNLESCIMRPGPDNDDQVDQYH